MYLHCNTNQTNLPLEIASCLSTHKGSFLDGNQKMMVENLACSIEQVNLSSLSGLSTISSSSWYGKIKENLNAVSLRKSFKKF